MTPNLPSDQRIWPILAVAFILRLGIFVIIAVSTSTLDNPLELRAFNGGDLDQYILLAQNMVDHGAFSLQTSDPFAPNVRRTPGYPLFLAASYIIAGHQHDPLLIVALQVGLSVLNVWLVIRIGTRLYSSTVGRMAGWIYGFAPATLIFTGLVMSETLFATLLLFGTWLCIRLYQSHPNRQAWLEAGLAGVVFAALAYSRPIALYFVPIPLLVILCGLKWSRRAFSLSVILLLAFVATVAPWLYRNYSYFDTPIFTSIGNQNLLFYNISSIEAQRQNISWDRARKELWDEFGRRLDQEYTKPNAANESSIAGKLAREHILRHPLDAVVYQTLDLLNTLRPGYSMLALILRDRGQEEVGLKVQEGDLNVLLDGNAYEVIAYVGMTVYYLLLYITVGIGSIAIAARRNVTTLILIGLTTFYFLYLPGKAGNARFRAPLEGYLALAGAVGLGQIFVHKWIQPVKAIFDRGEPSTNKDQIAAI